MPTEPMWFAEPKKYYSVVGYNGVLVADNQWKVDKSKTYIKDATVQEYPTFEEAERQALLDFEARLPCSYVCPVSLRLNDITFRKYLRRKGL